MTLDDALRSIVPTSATHGAAGDEDTVRVVLRLARSRRTWFITGVERTATGLLAIGFESGCIHSPSRRFRVTSDFFEVAARASAEDLLIELLQRPIPLATIEDASL
jgi:hypothetical protein